VCSLVYQQQQDPHLKRSFVVIVRRLGLSCLLPYSYNELKQSAVEKTVMFQEETINANADLSKDRKSIYRNHKLSVEDKKLLYADRPDLNPKLPLSSSPARTVVATPSIPASTDSSLTQALLESSDNVEVGGEQQQSSVQCSAQSPSESMDYSSEQAHLKLISLQQGNAATQEREPLVDRNQADDDSDSSGDEADEEDMDLNSPV
jgi:hypothetical protein